MINVRRLTATTHSQRCIMCARWMLCQSVQYAYLAGMRHPLVLCMECATECDCEVDE